MTKILFVLVILSDLIFVRMTEAGGSMSTNFGKQVGSGIVREAEAGDFMPLPPYRTESVSPNGQYVLVVQSRDEWKSKHAVGQLFHESASGRQLIWEKILPQEYGPRYALVGNQGQAIFFDEYINVKSKYAIMLINYQKALNISHDFDRVAALLDTSAASIIENATSGWWIVGKPTLDVSGATANVCAAQKSLRIDLNTGQLSVEDSSRIRTQKTR